MKFVVIQDITITLQTLKVKKAREFLPYGHEFMLKLQHSKTHENN